MKPPVHTVIFDLDGTILDSKGGVVESFSRAAGDVFPGVALNPAQIPIGPPIRALARQVFPDITPEQTEAVAEAFRLHYDRDGSMQTTLFQGALEMLSDLAKRSLAMDIATNKPLGVTSILLKHLGIARFFRAVLTVDSAVPPFANKTAILHRLIELNRLDPSHTLYVGDTAEDAVAAAACGLRFIWAAYGYGQLEGGKKPFAVINKLAELSIIL